MFGGELEALNVIRDTKTVSAPRPMGIGCTKSGHHFIVMEYLNMTSLNRKCSAELGNQLADMHIFNLQEERQSIKQFGFYVETCCGFLAQNNTWTDDWLVRICYNCFGMCSYL